MNIANQTLILISLVFSLDSIYKWFNREWEATHSRNIGIRTEIVCLCVCNVIVWLSVKFEPSSIMSRHSSARNDHMI